MPIKITCPECGKTGRVAEELAGSKVKCPACGALIAVPSKATEQPGSTAPPQSASARKPASDALEPSAPDRATPLPPAMPPMPSPDEEFDVSDESFELPELPVVGDRRRATAPQKPMEPLVQSGKPLGIVLTAMYFGFSACQIVLMAFLLAFMVGFAQGLAGAMGLSKQDQSGGMVLLSLMAMLYFVIGVIMATACYGLFTLQTWSYRLTQIVCGLGIAGGLLSLIASPSRGNVILVLVTVGLFVGILVYFARPQVRALFGEPGNVSGGFF